MMALVDLGSFYHEEESIFVLGQHLDRDFRHLRKTRLAGERVVGLPLVLVLHVVPAEQT